MERIEDFLSILDYTLNTKKKETYCWWHSYERFLTIWWFGSYRYIIENGG